MLNMPKLNKFYVPEIRIHPGNIHQNTLRMWKGLFAHQKSSPVLEVTTFIKQPFESNLIILSVIRGDINDDYEKVLVECNGITYIFSKWVYDNLIMLLPNSESYLKFSDGPSDLTTYLQIINPRIM